MHRKKDVFERMKSILFLQPPSPPGMSVTRDYAGGFGVAAHSRRKDYGHWQWSVPYVSLMYSAGVLEQQGHDIVYVDSQAERLNATETISRVRESNPRVIVAVVNLPSMKGDAALLKKVKSKSSDAKLVCIGTTCKVLPEDVAEMDFADAIVLGEPENVLPELVGSILDDQDIENVNNIGIVENGELHRTSVVEEDVDLESLPWPPYEVMPTTLYRDPYFGKGVRFLTMWASRGCPMPCSYYCPYPLGLGSKIRARPTDDIVNEIEHLNRNYGTSGFIFRDQIFTSNKNRAGEICDQIIDRKLKINWMCETRFDLVDENVLRKMKKAGCSEIHFGLETGDPDLLRRIGKPGMKLSTVKEAIRQTKKVGINPMTHIILGLPGETEDTIRNTLRTLRETRITSVSVNVATPYPGTALHKYASEKGLLETDDWAKYTSFNRVMRTESMTNENLAQWARYLQANLLGTTALERFSYLCKSKGILDYLSNISSKVWQSPSLSFQFLKNFVTTGNMGATLKMLREEYDEDVLDNTG